MVGTCNPSAVEADISGSLRLASQPTNLDFLASTGLVRDPVSNNKVDSL